MSQPTHTACSKQSQDHTNRGQEHAHLTEMRRVLNDTHQAAQNPDPGLAYTQEEGVAGGVPKLTGSLYNSMIYPLLPLNTKGWLWYQGEADAANPTYYKSCLPAMINEWRASWHYENPEMPTDTPFLF